jgi:hypothetical protein
MISILHTLIAAVAPILGVSIGNENDKQTWHIDFQPQATTQQRAAAQAVIDAFDLAAIQQMQQRIQDRQMVAHATAKAIPVWASWTQAQWQTYFTSNLSDTEADLVTTIAAARVMIKRQNLVILNLVKMLIAIRDQTWPDLPE